MDMLLSALKKLSEYQLLLTTVNKGKSAAVTGIGQMNRSHLIAALHSHTELPVIILCQDDMAAKRIQQELHAFLHKEFPILPSREFTLYDTAVVSRSWEQKRLHQLYNLAMGNTSIQIMTWESLSQRTMPKEVLFHAAFELRVGGIYTIDEIQQRLVDSGYTRCGMVEGTGQFAVRGGILDIFSPAEDQPVRIEFFGD